MALSPPSRRHRARAFFARLALPPRSHIRPTCPICLDVVASDASVMLRCGHGFCLDCMCSYATGKVRERHVRDDQLVCPVVECKRAMCSRDLRRTLDRETYAQYKTTKQRVRDEKHPLARWCPRPQCGELIRCTSTDSVFTCPKCHAIGCFHCRGPAHRFAFLCGAIPLHSDDASYVQWEKSLGDGRAVRACPRCHMRIWKTEGCNHMTCTHCYHQYCWVCDTPWHRRHYACGEAEGAQTSTDAIRRRAAQLEILTVRVIVALLACVSAIIFAPCLVLVTLARKVAQLLVALFCLIVQTVKTLVTFITVSLKTLVFGVVALVALPFLLVLAVRDACEEPESSPQKRRIIFKSKT